MNFNISSYYILSYNALTKAALVKICLQSFFSSLSYSIAVDFTRIRRNTKEYSLNIRLYWRLVLSVERIVRLLSF